MKHKALIFIMALLSVGTSSFAEKYTLKFSRDFFLYLSFCENCISVQLEDFDGNWVIELPDYTYVVVNWSEIGLPSEDEYFKDCYLLPVYVLDTIGANYEVTDFSYTVNESINIGDNIILDDWVFPTSAKYQTNMHPRLDYDGSFPVSTFVKYDFHRIKGKNVFYISPFMYDPFSRKLDLATSVTLDVETKRIESSAAEISGSEYGIYVGGENIMVEAESDRRQNIRIYDVSGRMVCSSAFVRNTAIDKSGFDSGVYIVNISDADGSHSRNIKIVI